MTLTNMQTAIKIKGKKGKKEKKLQKKKKIKNMKLASQNIVHNDAAKEQKDGDFGYSDGELFRFMFRYALNYKPQLLKILGLMLCYSVTTALAPIIIKVLIDKFTENTTTFFQIDWLDSLFIQIRMNIVNYLSIQFSSIIWVDVGLLAFSYLCLQTLSFIFSYHRSLLMSKLGLLASRDIATETFSHIQELDMGYHDRNEIGRIFSRLSTDIIAIRQFLGGRVVNNLANIVTIIIVLGFVFKLDPILGLVSMSIIPLIIIGGILGRRKIRVLRKESRRLNAKMIAYISESIAGIKITKQMNREEKNIDIFEEMNEKVKQANIKANKVGSFLFPYMIFSSTIGTALIILVGGYRIIGGILTIGALLAFLNYNSILFRPIVILGNLYQQLQDALTGAERVKALLDTPSNTPWQKDLPSLPEIEGTVDFEHIAFSYFKNTPIYKDFNLHVPKGQIVAFVGKTGAGKTTIINILNQFYPIQGGKLLIDGFNVHNYSLPSYRKQVVTIPQDFFIFSGSIRYNLMLGNPHATDEEMWEVLHQVGLASTIERTENGLDTFLQDRGRKLSMGQRQLLIFAAALLADPRILILDEATSSIDVFNEVKIQHAIDLLLENRTAFIIAHRMSTIRKADQIYVINDAQIEEQGTHKELMEKEGHYYSLIENQIELTTI